MNIKRAALSVIAGCAALVVGTVGGAALAQTPALRAPAGLTSDSATQVVPMPEPDYPVNQNGLTYGSAAAAPSSDSEPDLIEVIASNGVSGYVLKSELDDANGSAAAATFKSPAEALEWQAARTGKDVTIPVYDRTGARIVGEFIITAPEATEG
jgi:hypothetical protein